MIDAIAIGLTLCSTHMNTHRDHWNVFRMFVFASYGFCW